MNVKSSKVIINRFLFNKFGGGGDSYSLGAYNRMYYFVCQ